MGSAARSMGKWCTLMVLKPLNGGKHARWRWRRGFVPSTGFPPTSLLGATPAAEAEIPPFPVASFCMVGADNSFPPLFHLSTCQSLLAVPVSSHALLKIVKYSRASPL
jgi:hypothetical protein